jgi:hypothetical protein
VPQRPHNGVLGLQYSVDGGLKTSRPQRMRVPVEFASGTLIHISTDISSKKKPVDQDPDKG